MKKTDKPREKRRVIVLRERTLAEVTGGDLGPNPIPLPQPLPLPLREWGWWPQP